MSYVSLRRAAATAAVAVVSAVALAGPATASVNSSPDLPQQGSPVVPGNGIIMSDGRICNPRWGC